MWERELVWTVLEKRQNLFLLPGFEPLSVMIVDSRSQPYSTVITKAPYLKNREIDGIKIVGRTLNRLCEWQLERTGYRMYRTAGYGTGGVDTAVLLSSSFVQQFILFLSLVN